MGDPFAAAATVAVEYESSTPSFGPTLAVHQSPDVIRVVLADDHQVVRAGLRALLGASRDISIVGEAGNGADAVALVERLCPDVVVLDMDMPRMDGLAATALLTKKRSHTRVLVLTMHSEIELLTAAMEAGALGVLVKNVADRELSHAIRIVARGDFYVPRQLRATLPARFTPCSSPVTPTMRTSTPVLAALGDDDARAFLRRHRVGRIAFSYEDRVDIEPIHFTFDGDWLFGRTSVGTKLATLAHHPWCAFEVDEAPAMFEWTSVVVKGTFYLLDPQGGSPDLYGRALERVRALVPGTFTPDDPTPHRTILFGIHVNEITGRRSRIAEG